MLVGSGGWGGAILTVKCSDLLEKVSSIRAISQERPGLKGKSRIFNYMKDRFGEPERGL